MEITIYHLNRFLKNHKRVWDCYYAPGSALKQNPIVTLDGTIDLQELAEYMNQVAKET